MEEKFWGGNENNTLLSKVERDVQVSENTYKALLLDKLAQLFEVKSGGHAYQLNDQEVIEMYHEANLDPKVAEALEKLRENKKILENSVKLN